MACQGVVIHAFTALTVHPGISESTHLRDQARTHDLTHLLHCRLHSSCEWRQWPRRGCQGSGLHLPPNLSVNSTVSL